MGACSCGGKMARKNITRLNANLPDESGEYKVVQVTIDGVLHMGFSSTERRPIHSHSSILEHLLEENGYCTLLNGKLFLMTKEEFVREGEQRRIYDLVEDQSSVSGIKIPALSGDGYKVNGMGKVDINADQKSARFFGTSMSYEIGLDEDLLKLLEEQEIEWTWGKNDK